MAALFHFDDVYGVWFLADPVSRFVVGQIVDLFSMVNSRLDVNEIISFFQLCKVRNYFYSCVHVGLIFSKFLGNTQIGNEDWFALHPALLRT